METKSILTTKQSMNYGVTFNQGRPESIIVEDENGVTTEYSVSLTAGKEQVTIEILEQALKAMLRSNLAAFEILYVCLHDTTYREIATNVFKEYWNELYNTVVAGDIFQRENTVAEINKTYDFFEKSRVVREEKYIEGGTKEAITNIQKLIRERSVICTGPYSAEEFSKAMRILTAFVMAAPDTLIMLNKDGE